MTICFYIAPKDLKTPRTGEPIVVGQTVTMAGNDKLRPEPCHYGMHGSIDLNDALRHRDLSQGVPTLVEITGDVQFEQDKLCGRHRKTLAILTEAEARALDGKLHRLGKQKVPRKVEREVAAMEREAKKAYEAAQRAAHAAELNADAKARRDLNAAEKRFDKRVTESSRKRDAAITAAERIRDKALKAAAKKRKAAEKPLQTSIEAEVAKLLKEVAGK